jgi:hypothetical protein
MPVLRKRPRRAAILPLTVLCLVALVGMVALAIDLSLLALARTQAQNAADAAAMAATRTLDGNAATNNNISAALTNGVTVAKQGMVVGQPITDSQIDLEIGVLNPTSAAPYFAGSSFTSTAAAPPSGANWGMAKVTITGSMNTNFATVFGISSLPYAATSQAIHRPRDVALVLDFSGSMAFDSYNAAPPAGAYPGQTWSGYSTTYPAPQTTSLNPDTLMPKFGHYDPNTTSGTYAALVSDGTNFSLPTNEILKPGNNTASTNSGDAIAGDFLTKTTAGMVSAFTSSAGPTPVTAGSLDADNFPTTINGSTGSNPGGDKPLKVTSNGGPVFAKNVLEYLSSSPTYSNATGTTRDPSWEGSNAPGSGLGSPAYPNFKGYTFGPGFWGKTFFVWPPNPDDTPNPLVAASTVNDNTTANATGGPIKDWRQRFFWMVSGSQKKRLDDSNALWNPDGTMKPPGASTNINGTSWTVQINYEAVLAWISDTSSTGQLFPQNLRSGRILYYSSIPTSVASASTDYDQLFWKHYIDHVFGVAPVGTTGTPANATPLSGFGADFAWSSGNAATKIYPKPVPGSSTGTGASNNLVATGKVLTSVTALQTVSLTSMSFTAPASSVLPGDQIVFSSSGTSPAYTVQSVTGAAGSPAVTLTAPVTASANTAVQVYRVAYMDYRDNPARPKMRYWFGPMSVLDFLWDDFDIVNHYWRPGTCHEAPMWILKAGIQSALQDIQKNHPNDWVTLIYFCVPKGSASDGFGQRFNRVRAPLGKQYTQMVNSLWYPPAVLDSSGNLISITSTSPPGEIRPWDLSMNPTAAYNETPMAQGGTSPSMAFMLAYNQFSSEPTLQNYASTNGLSGAPSGDAGGNGRRGARKMIVFETDGVPNVTVTAPFASNGAYTSYYKIRQPAEWPSITWTANMDPGELNATYDVVKAICNYPTADRPGYTPSSGSALPGYSTQGKPVLIHTLAFGGMFESSSSLKPQCLSYLQQIQTYGGTQKTNTDPLPSWKVIIGDSSTRINSIRSAFTAIMQDGVQVSLFN